MCPAFALPGDAALEGEFAVQAEGRQEAGVVAAMQPVFARAEVVMGEVGADLWLDVAVGGLKTVGSADVAAEAVGTAQFVFVEVYGFAAEIKRQLPFFRVLL